MNNTNKLFSRGPQSSKAASLLALLVAIVLPFSVYTQSAVERWTADDIALLFPPPIEGWDAEGLELTATDTLTSDFEMMANSLIATSNTVSIRLIATQVYIAGERRYEMSIDTENIEVAAQVDAIAAGYSTDDGLRERLERDGIGVAEHKGFDGLSIVAGAESGRIYKIGSASVVVIACEYSGCGDDIDSIVETVDFASIARFVAFDHRRERDSDPEATWR